MLMNERHSNIEQLKGSKPFNPEAVLADFIPESLKCIESMDYVGAFTLFAERLKAIERQSPDLLFDESVQKPARATLKILWKAFLADVKDSKKKDERLHSMSGETSRRLEELQSRQKAAMDVPPISKDRLKYMDALRRQHSNTVQVFPNQASKVAGFRRQFDTMIQKTIEEPTRAAYEEEFRHIDYIGALFNDTMPLIRKLTEGYIVPMIEGKRGWSSYLPITESTLNGNLISFLKEAPGMAQAIVRGHNSRETANETAYRQLLNQGGAKK